MRLIDADALMDDIKRDSKKVIEAGDKVGSFWLGYAAGLVIAKPTVQPEAKWIPCDERLPKEKQSVLVTDGSVIWVCDIISTDEGYKWEDSHGYWLDLDEWTAWMSLPELYHGGGELE